MEYVLIEAAKIHEEYPGALPVLPTKEELESVGVNDCVRLIFDDGNGDGGQMWVKIVTMGESGGRGILINVPPKNLPKLELLDKIEFGLEHIARVIAEEDSDAQKGTY